MTERGPREERLFLPDPEPEPIVVVVRAVCGLLAGLFVAGVTWLKYFNDAGIVATTLWFIAWPVVFAWCAARMGDVFWERWLRSFWWR